jgi:hypothetical protein
VISAIGEVRYERAYYYCRHCGYGASPADANLHVEQAELTPAARELVALAGTLSSFGEAAEKVLPKLAGVRVSESTVERTTEAAGRTLGERLASGEVFGDSGPWQWSKDACQRTIGYVSLDATGVGIQGPNAAAAEGKMVDVGLIFDPGSHGRPSRMRAWAGLYTLEELGAQMRRQAAQVGLDAAEVWVGLTDGGSGLDEFLRVYFPRAELVLDFYHAAEHLNELAQALHPADESLTGELAGQWCHQLKHEGGAAVLATLEAIDLRGKKAEARERHRQVTGYVRNNVFRMDYPRYRANGWLIGSGHVESACKGVVGQRLKGNGMRWSEAGADAVCHLRALFKSEKGQWDAYWALAP